MPSTTIRAHSTAMPIGPLDTPVHLSPHRNAALPVLYKTVEHPLHRGSGTAYFYVQNGSMQAMKEVYMYEDRVKTFPQGSEEEALDQGYFRLLPGDAVFQRLSTGSSTGIDDVLVCLVTGRNDLHPDLVARSMAMRTKILGSPSLRTREAPSRKEGETVLTGGTHFERVFPEHQNIQDGRCYGFGTSFEIPTRIFAPAAQGKLSVASASTLDMRRDLIMVCTELAMKAIKTCPAEVEDHLRLNSEIYNLPSIGVDDNFAFTSYQLNIAPVRLHNSNETLRDSMGLFGDAHIDENDAPGHFTAVTVFSEIPERFDPGRMFLAYPGVFCELEFLTTVIFSGARRHGSSPPIATADATRSELDSAVRCIGVCYGGTGPTQYFQKRPIGVAGIDTSTAKGKNRASSNRSKGKRPKRALLFDMTPEMLNPSPNTTDLPRATRSTFINEGPSIMSPHSFMTFIGRSFLAFVVFMLGQIPSYIGAEVDSDAFLASFSYVHQDGRRRSLGPWASGPGWRARPPPSTSGTQEGATASTSAVRDMGAPVADGLLNQRDCVSRCLGQWKTYYDKYAGHVPFAVAYLKDVHPLEGDGNPPSKFPTIHPSTLPDDAGDDEPTVPEPTGPPSGTGNTARGNRSSNLPEWHGVDRQIMERVLVDARAGTAEYPIELSGSDDSEDSPMDISDEDEDLAADVPFYLKVITRQSVRSELLEVQNSLIVLEASGAFIDRVTVKRLLLGFHNAVFDQPLDAGSFGHIQAGWRGLQSMISADSESVFLTRMRRGSIMRINFCAWNWLETCIPQAIVAVYKGDHVSCPWLSRLVGSVRSALADGSNELVLHSLEYGVHLEDPVPASLDLSNFQPVPEDDVPLVVSIVQDVLATWLRFPTNGPAVYQARFVGSVVRLVGYEALLLDCVWRKCQKASKHYFRRCPPLPIINGTNARLFEVLDADSELRKDIRELYGIILDVFENHSARGRPQIGYRSGRLQGTLEGRINIFKQFIRDCYACFVDNVDIDNKGLRDRLRLEPDSYLPFRELAPSRRRYTASDGPFSPERVRTKEGILTGAIYRGVLFNSQYSRDERARAFFTSPEDFRRAIVNLPLDSVCNMSAYGAHSNSKRTPDLVDGYWDALQSVDWSIFRASEPIPFRTCFHFFKPTRGTRFQELGPLGAYMLTADYVYAGIVEWPDHNEMGRMIQFLNKSPVDAFELLGLIPPRSQGQGKTKLKASESDCIQAFSKVHDMVMDSLSPDQARRAGLDVIVTEHALCKFYRSKSLLGL